MTTMTLEAILERVQDLRQESREKDEVIRDQQVQIEELERKVGELDRQVVALQQELDSMGGAARQAEEMLTRLSEALAG